MWGETIGRSISDDNDRGDIQFQCNVTSVYSSSCIKCNADMAKKERVKRENSVKYS